MFVEKQHYKMKRQQQISNQENHNQPPPKITMDAQNEMVKEFLYWGLINVAAGDGGVSTTPARRCYQRQSNSVFLQTNARFITQFVSK